MRNRLSWPVLAGFGRGDLRPAARGPAARSSETPGSPPPARRAVSPTRDDATQCRARSARLGRSPTGAGPESARLQPSGPGRPRGAARWGSGLPAPPPGPFVTIVPRSPASPAAQSRQRRLPGRQRPRGDRRVGRGCGVPASARSIAEHQRRSCRERRAHRSPARRARGPGWTGRSPCQRAWPVSCSGLAYAGVNGAARDRGQPVRLQQRRRPEVHDLDPPVARHQDVRRLEVAMQHQGAVRECHPLAHLGEERQACRRSSRCSSQ